MTDNKKFIKENYVPLMNRCDELEKEVELLKAQSSELCDLVVEQGLLIKKLRRNQCGGEG